MKDFNKTGKKKQEINTIIDICPICDKVAIITKTKDDDGYTVYSCSECKRKWYNTLDRAKKG